MQNYSRDASFNTVKAVDYFIDPEATARPKHACALQDRNWKQQRGRAGKA
jgi:hypothetical protein